MAKHMKVVHEYSPRLKVAPMVELEELAKFVSKDTGWAKGRIQLIIDSLQIALVHYMMQGRPVRVEGLGIFKPGVTKDGKLRVNFKVGKNLLEKVEDQLEEFKGVIVNKEMIGKTMEEFYDRWDAEHPADKADRKR